MSYFPILGDLLDKVQTVVTKKKKKKGEGERKVEWGNGERQTEMILANVLYIMISPNPS